VADDADTTEPTVNGSIDVLAHSVKQIREPAETPAVCDVDSDTAAAAENEPTDADATADADTDDSGEHAARSVTPGIRLALVIGLAAILALGAVGVWLGYRAYQARQADELLNRFLAVGKQGALNLTTINYSEADADVQRILDSSMGQFYDDFSKRAPAFVDVVKKAQSKTQGNITEAGVESVSGDTARVLVAVAVTTSNAASPDQPTRHWRMRIDVQKLGETVKVSNVGFVP
jgi:Mce-associated membrane protein